MEIFKERANIPLHWEAYTITVVKSEAGITLSLNTVSFQ